MEYEIYSRHILNDTFIFRLTSGMSPSAMYEQSV